MGQSCEEALEVFRYLLETEGLATIYFRHTWGYWLHTVYSRNDWESGEFSIRDSFEIHWLLRERKVVEVLVTRTTRVLEQGPRWAEWTPLMNGTMRFGMRARWEEHLSQYGDVQRVWSGGGVNWGSCRNKIEDYQLDPR